MISTNSNQDKEFTRLLRENLGFEQIDATFVVEWVSDTFAPEEVFSNEELADWATAHGYIKE